MALTDFGEATWPAYLRTAGAQQVELAIAYTINASTDGVAIIFKAAETASIIGGSFTTLAVVTGEDVACELWNVSLTDGEPTAVIGSVAVDVTVADTDDNTVKNFTFGASHSATKGDLLALVFKAASGWLSGDIDLAQIQSMSHAGGFPYDGQTTDSGANWTLDEALCYAAGVEYTGNRWYPHGANLIPATSSPLIVCDGTPIEAGLKFTSPCDGRVTGVFMSADVETDITLEWYTTENPGSGTQIYSRDTNVRPTVSEEPTFFPFDTVQEVVKDTSYRLTMSRSSGTAGLRSLQFSAHEKKEAVGIPYSKRTDCLLCQDDGASGWDDTTYALYLPVMALCFDQFHDDDAGGGGGSAPHIIGA